MKFEEILMEFKKLKDMDIEDVVIAVEVDNTLDWLRCDEFEEVCKYIKKISRKKPEISIATFVDAIAMLVYNGTEIADIIKIKPKEFFKHLETYLD